MTDETPSLCERLFRELERRGRAAPAVFCGRRWNIFRARRSLTERDLPAAILWDDGESVEGDTGGGAHASMTILQRGTLELHVPANAEDTGRNLVRAKDWGKRVLCQNRGAAGDEAGKIGILIYTGADAEPRADGANSEAATLHFEARYKEEFGDPTRAR